jgi:hypothetical protein
MNRPHVRSFPSCTSQFCGLLKWWLRPSFWADLNLNITHVSVHPLLSSSLTLPRCCSCYSSSSSWLQRYPQCSSRLPSPSLAQPPYPRAPLRSRCLLSVLRHLTASSTSSPASESTLGCGRVTVWLFGYMSCRSSRSAEGEGVGDGRHSMALNSCVGSQVLPLLPEVLKLRIAMLIFVVQVLNLLLGVGLPCFISAAVSGKGGSIQVNNICGCDAACVRNLTRLHSA